MTTIEDYVPPAVAGQQNSPEAVALPSQRRQPPLGRPRSVEGDEAYHRSVLEQAAIDIAAGR